MALSNSLPSSVLKPGVCTSSNRPAQPYVGQFIYQTDNGALLVWDGSSWAIPSGPSSNPTSSNQFARKQYVDTQVAQVGTWQTHAGVTLEQTGAGTPTVNRGTGGFSNLISRYVVIGKLVTGYIRLVCGSTGVEPGDGDYKFKLPVTAKINLGISNYPCGNFHYQTSSLQINDTCVITDPTNDLGNYLRLRYNNSFIGSTQGLETSCFIEITYSYEAA
jgi:hypothetical protein